MCGRFQLSVKGKQISERFNVEVFDEFYRPNYNAAPGQKLPLITNEAKHELSYFKWGLIPFWAKDPRIGYKLINTRSETIQEKPSFRNAFARRRCLIPANGFYEWTKDPDKTPYRIFLKSEDLFAMAGIWEVWKDGEGKPVHTFSVITTTPNTLMQKIHDRMPVILPRELEMAWLRENDTGVLKSMLRPFDEKLMACYPVSKRVNTPANNDEALIVPADEPSGKNLFG
jgi:putative SOS response-associated peptidase YedK